MSGFRHLPTKPTPLLATYLEQRATLVRLFARRTGDAAIAEDVVQDLYLRLEAVASEERIDNPLAYLLRMANNIYLNRIRARASERTRDRAWHDVSHGGGEGEETVADQPSPEAEVSSRQQLLLLVTTLKALPERTQAIFRLHKIEGLSQTEVARRLDISISSVEKHLSAALKHLMTQMRAQNGGNGP